MLPRALIPPDRPRVSVRSEQFPLERQADGVRRIAEIVLVEIHEGSTRGRGECVPDPALGETVEAVIAAIEALADGISTGVIMRRSLQRTVPAGVVRNAIDLALWDFDAKRTNSSVWQIAGLDVPHRLTTAVTIPHGSAEVMGALAAQEAHRPLLKLELDSIHEFDRLLAVKVAAPHSRLIVDAHAGWTLDSLIQAMPTLKDAGVELIEDPLPASNDAGLASFKHEIPICANRSCRDRSSLPHLVRRYDAINIDLNRTGGFTEALALLEQARDDGFRIKVSSRVGTSLSTAPAAILGQDADWVDLDAPLLLARDRQPGLRFDGSVLYPPSVSLWG
ncbi:MAG TPA: enolase C-terminal domain-like protein [Aliidongia sp.]|uniref:enolase C-terminal domain-like protein n=1 Tax=Aliidongia sp. TaxID=1914230 RepID=UPI002DDDABF1|nr:enolase C-terminal domain-like protein [Aliidongia sp.]HEV2678826.1 enolase C-terminal domain-like protein [Aliidongia sp.]